MTGTAGRQFVSAGWQTWLVLAATVAVGRWATGPTFGYALFATAWGPIAALWMTSDESRRWRAFIEAAATAGLLALPWAFELSARTALTVVSLQALFTLSLVSAIAVCRGFWLGNEAVRALLAVTWLTWVVLPLTMSSLVQAATGELGFDHLLAVHPVLLMNAAIESAGDWTHQNLAYVHLTRLGQDVAFDWPASRWTAVAVYGSIFACGVLRQMFHVEHRAATTSNVGEPVNDR